MPFNQILLYLQKELLKCKQEARNLQGIKVRKGTLCEVQTVKLWGLLQPRSRASSKHTHLRNPREGRELY